MDPIAHVSSGRTDRVFDLTPEQCRRPDVLRSCAYFGDVSAIRHLLAAGAELTVLGDNLDLNGAAFHGHWQLTEFLIAHGADVNRALPGTGETPLHAALCSTARIRRNRVLRVLLAAGANVNRSTVPGAESGGFMRDARTRGETPLHRAAAFGDEEAIELLLAAGAQRDARDANGDSPLSWASWHLRSSAILRLLCFGEFRIRETHRGMEENLAGDPLV